jgi:ribosomal protein L40E
MEDYGTQKFRIGGVGGELSYLIGDIVEIEQETLPVQVHICPKCGKVEFTATEQTGARFLSRKGLKKCIKCGARIPLASEECPHCGAKQQKPKS